jgi:Glycine-rich domain-containing protein-like
MNAHAITLSESFVRIAALDLEAVKFKLVHEGKAEWDVKRADDAEVAYKRFLMLAVKYPGQRVVPTDDVDAIWHQHILDTRAYMADCEYALGYFLHHWPYSGTLGPDDEALLKVNFIKTCDLYAEEFGESYAAGGSCSDCGSSCDGGGHGISGVLLLRPRLARSAA